VKSHNHRPILSAAKIYVNDSTFWQNKSFVDIRMHFLPGRRQTGVRFAKIDEIAVFPLPYLRTFQNSEVTSALIAHFDHIPFWISACTNKDDLE